MKMHENRNQTMDSSFYQDESAQYQSQSAQNTRKRPETLDLNKQPAKKPRFNQSLTTPAVLNSPDVQKLSMATPDIEKFIISHTTLQTPTPSLVFPQTVRATTEQEDYARGFEVALNNLRQNDHRQQQQHHHHHQQQSLPPPQQPTGVEFTTTGSSIVANTTSITTSPPTSSGILSMNGGSITYTNLDDFPATIKEEPQTVPNSPPLSPIDMESQERIKLERKRQRNRVAASKCRKRKLERISKLEDKVKVLKNENSEMGSVIKALKEHVCQLKQQVIEHVSKGCNIPSYNVPFFNKADSDIKITTSI